MDKILFILALVALIACFYFFFFNINLVYGAISLILTVVFNILYAMLSSVNSLKEN